MGLIGGFCLSLIAIFAPPVPVLLRAGCGGSLLVNCILTILGWIPGVFHAWYIIIRYPDGKRAATQRTREVRTYEARRSHSSGRGRQRNYARPPPQSYGYAAPPAAQSGLYYPPQEMGRVRRY